MTKTSETFAMVEPMTCKISSYTRMLLLPEQDPDHNTSPFEVTVTVPAVLSPCSMFVFGTAVQVRPADRVGFRRSHSLQALAFVLMCSSPTILTWSPAHMPVGVVFVAFDPDFCTDGVHRAGGAGGVPDFPPQGLVRAAEATHVALVRKEVLVNKMVVSIRPKPPNFDTSHAQPCHFNFEELVLRPVRHLRRGSGTIE